MTEDHAKTLWCPMVRTGLTAGMSVNRHVADAPGAMDGVHDETRCIASGCMMWRYRRKEDGYCGLAGSDHAL
jgi:hypothetical protein